MQTSFLSVLQAAEVYAKLSLVMIEDLAMASVEFYVYFLPLQVTTATMSCCRRLGFDQRHRRV